MIMADAVFMDKGFRNQRESNGLLRLLVCVSVAIHIVIFLHISGLYRSSAMQYIELSMQDLSDRFSRTIPRPVLRPKKIKQPETIKKIRVNPNRIPRIQPTQINPVNTNMSKNLMAQINVPELPSGFNDGGGNYHIGEILDTSTEFTSAKSYFEMVILKIETTKKYPASARAMQKEGRITVSFTLTLQGNVNDVRIVNSCPHTILNQAAIKAVMDAAPFPRPPYRYFKKDISLELNIIFETT